MEIRRDYLSTRAPSPLLTDTVFYQDIGGMGWIGVMDLRTSWWRREQAGKLKRKKHISGVQRICSWLWYSWMLKVQFQFLTICWSFRMSFKLVRSLAVAGRAHQHTLGKQVLVRSCANMGLMARISPAATKPLLNQSCFTPSNNFSTESPTIFEKIEGLVKESKVVVFMKGVPAAPQCGFSNAVVQIMRSVCLLSWSIFLSVVFQDAWCHLWES